MVLLDRQKRTGKQIGEIRLGLRIPVPNKPGKLMPSKGETLRFTTESRWVARDVAVKLGGEVHETELLSGRRTFEVISNVTEVPVMVPEGESVINQHYEMWSKAGCARRCNGFDDSISGDACKCPADLVKRMELAMKNPPAACKPVTRLYVMLPYIADLGVWLVQSTGNAAADELGEIAEVLRRARQAGVPIPAMLRMEQRISRLVGEKPHEYVVPVLDTPETSLYDLLQLSEHAGLSAALPPVPDYARQPNAISVESTSMRTLPHHESDDVIDAELADDASHAPGRPADLPDLAGYRQDVPENMPLDHPRPSSTSAGRADAGPLIELEALRAHRTSQGLAGNAWTKFAAMHLGGCTARKAQDMDFTAEEIATLLVAMSSRDRKVG